MDKHSMKAIDATTANATIRGDLWRKLLFCVTVDLMLLSQ
jgi:hypothetical protein